ncbi:hypothetical protein [Arthrobacter sp. M4]|uniref:hypothetical protein n=1 Tax=Arthrobacter sp. M4 TaxID=218160 RepID=UPI001CDCFBB8|nr:hypothetical protein [Arthrobacter sp. M4]MCA4133606.1 hypothetical protein [Arthrobacter sp. M4]
MTGTLVGPTPDLARVTARKMRKASKRLHAVAAMVLLRCINRFSHQPVTGTADVVVSMTSYGERIRTVDVALESIARGIARPRRLILWLDEPEAMDHLPKGLERLRERGLEVKLSQNFGPHTKYFPYVACNGHSNSPLVTADDDIIYPDTWLQELVEANQARPTMIHGHWVRTITVNGGSLTGYQDWIRRRDTLPGLNNFALGVSGVIYPPRMLKELKARGDVFQDACPGADDIWLHWVALRAGIPVCQVDGVSRHFPMIPGSQANTLSDLNVGQSRNDHWIRALYSTADVSAMTGTFTQRWSA